MKFSGEVIAIISAIFIGLSVPIATETSREIGVIQATTYTSLISVIFLVAISLISKQKIQFQECLKKHFKESMSIVLARPVVGNLLLIYGFSLTLAIKSSFLLLLEPIFVTVMSYIFLKDKINVKQISLIFLMILGAFLLSTSGNISVITQAQVGDILIVLALLFFSYSYIPAKRIENTITPVTITIVNNLVGGLILFSIMLFLPITLFPINYGNAWLILGYVLTYPVIGLYLYFYALKKTKPWIVSSLLTLSAVSGAIVGYFWLGESINSIQLIGAIIIFASSYFITRVKV